jgi:uncharacterized membrane protein
MDPISIIGRFHPVLVHLPIGIFVAAILLSALSMVEQYKFLKDSTRIILGIGLITAVLSMVSGYVLSLEGSNSEADVEIHQWTAIGMTLIYAAYFFFSPLITNHKYPNLIALLILLGSLVLTGHQGGSLTHGENFLWSIGTENDKKTTLPVITDIQKADIYRDIVGHTLQTKCVECHGANKQKGKLRLDDPTWIDKGGKNGAVLVKGDADNSELIKRLLLDESDDHHMPPKEKEQLTTAEKSILSWWIRTGAKYTASVESLAPDENILKELENFKSNLTRPEVKNIERPVVTAADALLIQSLKKIGWVISPIAVNDNHLRATGFNLTVDIDSALTLLGGVADQLIELKLNKSGINDSSIYRIEKFQSLEKLWLENNSISDIGINSINKLKHLQYLNLSNTQITTTGLKKIISLGQLRSIYVSRTEIRPEEAKQMMALLKNVKIFTTDSLPKLPTDSLLVKKEK